MIIQGSRKSHSMQPLKILYVGPNDGTSLHRFRSLKRLGHNIELVDPFKALAGSSFYSAWGFKTGYLGLEGRITRHVLNSLQSDRYDIVWVDNGETVGKRLASELKRRCDRIINHNLDNPFTNRDGARWRLFLSALPLYDLFITPRRSSQIAALEAGATRAVEMMQSADEEVHRHVTLVGEEGETLGSEVVFAGTWMPERGPFMKHLIDRGVPLRIFGPRWTKAPEYQALKSVVTARGLDDATYVKVISGSKIALGLLSAGNNDVHTTRSLEIPAIGTPFCGPRTSDHQVLYQDGVEAVFFDTADECADICLALLQDEQRRQAIGAAGYQRALKNGRFNERICRDILALVANLT
jgi:spore maturation protein CgeB